MSTIIPLTLLAGQSSFPEKPARPHGPRALDVIDIRSPLPMRSGSREWNPTAPPSNGTTSRLSASQKVLHVSLRS